MAKKKQTQKKQPKKQVAKKGRPRPPNASMSMAMQVCAVTNPFCAEAKGARWPDNSYTKSVGISFEASSILTTDPNGTVSQLLLTGERPMVADGTITAGIAAYNSMNLFPGLSGITGLARWRLTSCGVRINCVSTRMNTAGRLRLRLFSPMNGGSLASVALNTIYADSMLDIPLSRLIEKDVFVIPMPLGDVARLYNTASAPYEPGPISGWLNPGWQVLQIAVEGGQVDTPCVGITVYYNYEYVFDDASNFQLLAQPPPSNSLAIQQANAGVLASVGNFVEGSAQRLDSFVQSSAFRWFGTAAAAYYGGPQAAFQANRAIGGAQSARRGIMVD